MSMIVNVGESGQFDLNHQLPEHHHFEDVINALEHDEETVGVLNDDPMDWYSLLAAVGNYLYRLPPDAITGDFFLGQLVGHFSSIVDDVHEQYCDDGTDDDDEGSDDDDD